MDDLANVKAQVFKVENQSGKLVIEGKNLNATQKVRIKGNSIDNEMVIQSKSKTRIIAALSQALTFTASAVYELVLSNAYGQSVYQLSFEIQDGQVTTVKLADGAVTGDKISDMGALSGQILKYNGTTWSPADLNSLVYAGTWDASTGTEPGSAPVGGDFWIVDTDGDVDLGDGNGVRQWRIGDWIVYNSFTGQWDQVISSQSVVSFNGRAGEVTPEADDYTWQQIDKTLAPIDDLTDVDTATTPPSNGEVLKWDGSNWTPQVDENDGGDITSVNAGTGLLGGATSGDADLDIDVGTSANQIPQLDGSGLLLNSIIPGLDTSKITSGTMNTARLPYASSTTDGIISSSDYQTFSGTDTTLSNGAAGEYLDGDGSWYVLDKAAVGLGNVTNDEQIPASSLDTNTNLGTDDTLVPSQNAVKAYVDSSVSTASNDYLLRDGTQAMTGDFDGGANNLTNINNSEVGNELRFIDDGGTNYVALKSRPTVSTNQTWLLPTSDGGAGQVLSTDGSGNLSWASSGDGSVTDVTATLPVESSGGTTPDISIVQSNSTTDGYLSSTDWNTFNDKQSDLNAPTDPTQYLDGTENWQTLDTDAVTESGNLYFTDQRAKDATVDNAINGAETDRAPSQSAVATALADKADSTDLDDYVEIAGDTMLGTLNLPADGFVVGTNQLVANGGNIGIGTNSPAAPLHISSGGTSKDLVYNVSSDVPLYSGLRTASSSYDLHIDSLANTVLNLDHDGNGANKFFQVRDSSQSSILHVEENGNVGIGTTTPDRQLHIRNGTNDNHSIRLGGFSAGSSFSPVLDGSDFGSYIEGGDNSQVVVALRDNDENDGLRVISGGGDFMSDSTYDTPVFTARPNGYIGVGTSSPEAPLEINGGAAGTSQVIINRTYRNQGGDVNDNSPFTLRRNESDAEAMMTYLQDGQTIYHYRNDEVSSRVYFTLENTDTETGGGASASQRTVLTVMSDATGGYVGVNNTSPSYELDVNGTIRGDNVAASDRRLKKNIAPIASSLEKITKLNGVSYDWKDPKKNKKRQVGVIAQDVKKVFPEVVESDRDGFLAVKYSHLIAPVIESIKELFRKFLGVSDDQEAMAKELKYQKELVKKLEREKDMLRERLDKQGREISSIKEALGMDEEETRD